MNRQEKQKPRHIRSVMEHGSCLTHAAGSSRCLACGYSIRLDHSELKRVSELRTYFIVIQYSIASYYFYSR